MPSVMAKKKSKMKEEKEKNKRRKTNKQTKTLERGSFPVIMFPLKPFFFQVFWL